MAMMLLVTLPGGAKILFPAYGKAARCLPDLLSAAIMVVADRDGAVVPVHGTVDASRLTALCQVELAGEGAPVLRRIHAQAKKESEERERVQAEAHARMLRGLGVPVAPPPDEEPVA